MIDWLIMLVFLVVFFGHLIHEIFYMSPVNVILELFVKAFHRTLRMGLYV